MRRLVLIAGRACSGRARLAVDMPTRKAGLWELKMEFVRQQIAGARR